tara:strand:- start:32 stop:703 length:672 start_codon:yes stop_codon:yes gene_type:complete
MGNNALKFNFTTGTMNTAFGYEALMMNSGGDHNTAVGYGAGNANTTANYNTFIGCETTVVSEVSCSNSTALGHAATITASNQVVLGTASETVIIPGSLSIAGTTLTATAAELNTYILNVALDDISTASSCFVVAPKAGTITKITSIIDGTTTTADAVITANVNGGGNNITALITIASGSVAAAIDTCSPVNYNTVTAGQYIKLTTDGESSGTVKAVFTIEITY